MCFLFEDDIVTGKIIIGRIKLPDGHFSDSWYVETRGARLHENDLLVVSPFDYWFRDNQDKLYDAILNVYMRGTTCGASRANDFRFKLIVSPGRISST